MPERGFLIFWFFVSIFFGISFPWPSINGIRDKIFFLLFSAYLIPFWLKIMPEWGFLIFLIFYLFFRNFLPQAEYERNSGLKFFSLLLGLSNPVLAKNNTGKRVFHFLNFFCNFLQNFLARIEYEWNSGLKFFSLFLGISNPVLAKNNAGMRFFNLLNFFYIFVGIFMPGSSMNRIWD